MILHDFRTALGSLLARFQFRKVPRDVISFTHSISSARHALLIMPLDEGMGPAPTPVLDFLKRKFPEQNITIVTREHDLSLSRLLLRGTVIRLRAVDVGTLFLPRKPFLNQIAPKQYDLAIDLNLDFLLPSAYICRASNARVRVGFTRKRSEVFYNFAIQPNPTLNRQDIYERLAKCLEMF